MEELKLRQFRNVDISLFACGNGVTIDATGYRHDKLSSVEIHIGGNEQGKECMCLVLDGNQAHNLLKALQKSLNSNIGKDNIVYENDEIIKLRR